MHLRPSRPSRSFNKKNKKITDTTYYYPASWLIYECYGELWKILQKGLTTFDRHDHMGVATGVSRGGGGGSRIPRLVGFVLPGH